MEDNILSKSVPTWLSNYKTNNLNEETNVLKEELKLKTRCRQLIKKNYALFEAINEKQKTIAELENQYLSFSNNIFKNQQNYLKEDFCVKEKTKIKQEWKIFSCYESSMTDSKEATNEKICLPVNKINLMNHNKRKRINLPYCLLEEGGTRWKRSKTNFIFGAGNK